MIQPKISPEEWPILFVEFWKAWPYKTAKRQAEVTFEKLHRKGILPAVDVLREAIEWQVESGCLIPAKSKDGRDTRPHPSTWLNDRRWMDEKTKETRPMTFYRPVVGDAVRCVGCDEPMTMRDPEIGNVCPECLE